MRSADARAISLAAVSFVAAAFAVPSEARAADSYWLACYSADFADREPISGSGWFYRIKAAQQAATVARPGIGQCAWFDRPLNPDEAGILLFLSDSLRQQAQDQNRSLPGSSFTYLLVERVEDSGKPLFYIHDWSNIEWLPDPNAQGYWMACTGSLRTENHGMFKYYRFAAATHSFGNGLPGAGECAWYDRPLNPTESQLPLTIGTLYPLDENAHQPYADARTSYFRAAQAPMPPTYTNPFLTRIRTPNLPTTNGSVYVPGQH